jgi:hypothetical protein
MDSTQSPYDSIQAIYLYISLAYLCRQFSILYTKVFYFSFCLLSHCEQIIQSLNNRIIL